MRTLRLPALNVKCNEGDDPVVIVVDSIDDDTDPNTWDSGTSDATIRVSDYDPDTDTGNDN
jgi:hypothetical protein